jgi:hypothetical protein
MKLDKVALPILVTAVFNYKWCIKYGECNIEILRCQTLTFCLTLMTDSWWLLMLGYLQILCNRPVSCAIKTKFQSNVYDEGI